MIQAGKGVDLFQKPEMQDSSCSKVHKESQFETEEDKFYYSQDVLAGHNNTVLKNISKITNKEYAEKLADLQRKHQLGSEPVEWTKRINLSQSIYLHEVKTSEMSSDQQL